MAAGAQRAQEAVESARSLRALVLREKPTRSQTRAPLGLALAREAQRKLGPVGALLLLRAVARADLRLVEAEPRARLDRVELLLSVGAEAQLGRAQPVAWLA